MYCRNCGKEVNEKAVACTNCGLPPLMEKNFCFECGVVTNIKQVMCVKCGVSLENKVTKGKPINEGNGNGNEYEGLYRSSDNKVLFGFCGGLAHKFGMQVSVVRILTIVSGFFLIGWLYFLSPLFPKYPTKF
jgi:phage shock protein PspC (stress-responsive transcriptional regulator)